MSCHERERKNKENANFVHNVYPLTKLCNIFDEAFFIDVSISSRFSHGENNIRDTSHRTYGSSNSNWYVKFQMFMSARAFWRVSYFAVFYKEYLNFSWYNLIEAYIFSISI